MAEISLPRTPYDVLGVVKWTAITEWERLDFVRALPDDIKEKLRKLPPEAEPEYEYCQMNQRMMPRLNPFRSREYWLQHYNKEYEPYRKTNARLKRQQDYDEYCARVEQQLIHISELMEHMRQQMARTANAVEEVAKLYCDINGVPF